LQLFAIYRQRIRRADAWLADGHVVVSIASAISIGGLTMTKFASRRIFSVIAALLILGAGVFLLVRATNAQSPNDADAVLQAEISAVQRDVAGAASADERAAAQAKLQVLLDEKAARDTARAKRPATKAEDATKFAELDASSKQAEAETTAYTPVLRSTETGDLLEGTPWNTNDRSFVANTWWRSSKASDGTRLAVWAGSIRTDSARGAVLARRFIDDGAGTVVRDQLISVSGHGGLSFVDEHGGVLTLRAADGTEMAFDTRSLTFR
jgi:hypothetical protein